MLAHVTDSFSFILLSSLIFLLYLGFPAIRILTLMHESIYFQIQYIYFFSISESKIIKNIELG